MNSKYLLKNVLSLLFLLIIGINITSCKKEVPKIDIKKTGTVSNIYSEVKIEKVKIKENSENITYELKTSEMKNIFLTLDLEKETSILEIDSQKINTDFNFSYDIAAKDAIDEIKLLANDKNNLIFLFPSITEEYLTFQILKYDQLKKTFSDSHFYFETHEDIHQLYVDSKATLSEQNSSYLLEIGSYQFKGNFQPIDNTTQKNSSAHLINSNNNRNKTIIETKTYPSDLKGMWAVICQNELTELSVNKNEGFLSLYDFNAIYINLKVERSSNKNEYLLKYASVSSQENYYKEYLKIVDEEISKDKVIGKLILQKNGKAELQWIGLYNMKKQKLEFVGNDFLLIKENGGKLPLILEPCH
ncbi:hypothetical protein [Chryseobacterium sp. 2987]|uniref:hypothetical protein n=1 Tax=Chryseobacterium sp. 2987 TaxID=2817767 RepID=UPI00285AF518|nr:hypothetical protein [Chryseobacterium sp. 2987]MDR6923080.1 hypothetical protein [Chryseobacterium sp. 2987]